jgi:hypothetical protein
LPLIVMVAAIAMAAVMVLLRRVGRLLQCRSASSLGWFARATFDDFVQLAAVKPDATALWTVIYFNTESL